MAIAYKKNYPADYVSPATQSAITDINEGFHVGPPVLFGTLADTNDIGALLYMNPGYDVVIKDILFNVAVTAPATTLASATTQVQVEVFSAWDATPTAPGTGTSMRNLVGFDVISLTADAFIYLSEQHATTDTGRFPFVLPKGYFLVGRVHNHEGAAIYPLMQVVTEIVTDQIHFSPVQPTGRCTKTIRVE
jgi:hypothetical protein